MWPRQLPNCAQGAFRDFLNTPLDELLERHLRIPPIRQALSLYRDVVESVPAYNAFLKSKASIQPLFKPQRTLQHCHF